MQDTEGTHLLEPQKAYPTDEFVTVTLDGGGLQLCLLCRLSIVLSKAVRLKFEF